MQVGIIGRVLKWSVFWSGHNWYPTLGMLSQKKQVPISLKYEKQEPEDDTREEEAARQKEFLEKVVISQKGQLRQLEKVANI